MGLIHVDLFTTVDGVAQAPGGPEEDLTEGFAFGGWQAPLIDEVVGDQVVQSMSQMDALLLGRRTYDLFAAYWPHQGGVIAERLNRIPKYLVSRTPRDLQWAGTQQLGTHLGPAISELRERHEHTHVIGSLNLVQTLLTEGWFDRLNLWTHPVLLGSGKRVFADGTVPTRLKLVEPAVTSPSGVVLQRYERLHGTPGVGDMSESD